MGATSGTRKKSVHGAGSGPGQGPGWGGSAKGAHAAIESIPVAVNMRTMATLAITDPAEYEMRVAKNVSRRQRSSVLEDELYNIGMDIDTHPATRVQAIDKALDRLKGKAIQPTVAVTPEDVQHLSDDELRAELERLGGTQGSIIEGDAAEEH